MNTTQTTSNTSLKRALPLLSVFLFFTFFLLFSCGGFSDDKPAPRISALKAIVETGEVPAQIPAQTELINYGQEAVDALSPIASTSAKDFSTVYVTVGGAGKQDGSSWGNAYAAAKLKDAIDGAGNDAIAAKPYLVFVGSGTYPIRTTLSMKNNVAIIGGIASDWSLGKATIISGDGRIQVFENTDLSASAALYGVTITNGRTAENGAGMSNLRSSPSLIQVTFSGNTSSLAGGGMYNKEKSSPSLRQVTFSDNMAARLSGGGMANVKSSSPSLSQVTFSGNTADSAGGGMANRGSSSTLNQVTFSGNTAGDGGGGLYSDTSTLSLSQVAFFGNTTNLNGGGMYNIDSSPSLNQVMFSGNRSGTFGGGMYNFNAKPNLRQVVFHDGRAAKGGGMYSDFSSPTLSQVTFSGNKANDGGGMYNILSSSFPSGFFPSSPTSILSRVTFSGNTATSNGGGMYNDNGKRSGHTVISNSIFWGNKAGTGSGNAAIYMKNDATGTENLSIHNSVLQGGIAAGIVYEAAAVNDVYPNTNVVSSSIIADDPKLTNDTLNLFEGASVSIPAIQSGSPSIDMGLYVKEKDSTFYYSENSITWYTGFDANGLSGTGTPPDTADDLTATDITGFATTGRPDIGAYEFR